MCVSDGAGSVGAVWQETSFSGAKDLPEEVVFLSRDLKDGQLPSRKEVGKKRGIKHRSGVGMRKASLAMIESVQ